MSVHRQPLSWYVDKLERGETFTSLLYGDGEFTVMAGMAPEGPYTSYHEVVTNSLRQEMLASVQDRTVIHGTDLNLVEYDGGDQSLHRFHKILGHAVDKSVEWHDGTVWEVAVREGKLFPLIQQLRRRSLGVIAHPKVCKLPFLACHKPESWASFAPDRNACGEVDHLDQAVSNLPGRAVVVVCCGLAAIPLIMRLRRRFPGTTFLDLGSTFDIFVDEPFPGIRGWMTEMRADKALRERIIRANLEGP